MEELNTVSVKDEILITECKLLLSNQMALSHSLEFIFDEILAGELYRTVWCENIEFFDKGVLRKLVCFADYPVRAALAYSLRDGVCRILSSPEYSAQAYAAAALALYFNGRISVGEKIRIISERGSFFAFIHGDTVHLYC